MVLDDDLRNHLEQMANERGGGISQEGLGTDDGRETKKTIECTWGNEPIILGFMVNVETRAIQLPRANVGGSQRLLGERRFNPGRFALTSKAMQKLRGTLLTGYNVTQYGRG